MKPASPRTVARYVVGLAILVAAQQTAIPNPINPATVVAAYVGARFSATVPPSESRSQSPPPHPSQKLSNPLNDLLDEAQHAIDKNDFAAAIPPLEKFLAEKDRKSVV